MFSIKQVLHNYRELESNEDKLADFGTYIIVLFSAVFLFCAILIFFSYTPHCFLKTCFPKRYREREELFGRYRAYLGRTDFYAGSAGNDIYLTPEIEHRAIATVNAVYTEPPEVIAPSQTMNPVEEDVELSGAGRREKQLRHIIQSLQQQQSSAERDPTSQMQNYSQGVTPRCDIEL